MKEKFSIFKGLLKQFFNWKRFLLNKTGKVFFLLKTKTQAGCVWIKAKIFPKFEIFLCISFPGKRVRKSMSVIIDVKFSNTFFWKTNARIKSKFEEHLPFMHIYPAWVWVFNKKRFSKFY